VPEPKDKLQTELKFDLSHQNQWQPGSKGKTVGAGFSFKNLRGKNGFINVNR
jgi:hypothetical protein